MYYLFVAPFDMKDKRLLVTFKDGDNTHLHPQNLMLSNKSTEIVRSFENGRRIRGSFNTKPQKVIQLNEKQEVLNRFPSINQAAQYLGRDSKII